MPDHASGNPDLIHQHKVIQRQGDQELKGAEPKGKATPDLNGDAVPEERVAGIVKPDDGSKPHRPAMKPATGPEIDGEAGGEGSTGSGADAGP